ncbi:MAG: hypothetical protein IKP32_01225 [Clostridia bacterium]|nr:hypothetical protein [Clostridia bacterium]
MKNILEVERLKSILGGIFEGINPTLGNGCMAGAAIIPYFSEDIWEETIRIAAPKKAVGMFSNGRESFGGTGRRL